MKILKFIGFSIAALGGLYVLTWIGFYLWARNTIDIEFKDVSHESAYRQFIGANYKTTSDSYIIKIEQDNGPLNGKTVIYSVMPKKMDEDDFLLNEKIPAQTRFVLEKIVRSNGGYNNEAAIIRFTSTDKYSDSPVYFDHIELTVTNEWTEKID